MFCKSIKVWGLVGLSSILWLVLGGDIAWAAGDVVVPDTGDTTFILISAALVLLMTPGLAFFYGGFVRSRNILNRFLFGETGQLFVGNDPSQLLKQLARICITYLFAGVGTVVLLKILEATIGLRVHEAQEIEGLDINNHGEEAYNELLR